MKDILRQLNQEVGVKGSVVVTQDGMVVASVLGVGLHEDAVAAIASQTILNIRSAIAQVGAMAFQRMVLVSTYGKMIFVDAGIAYLVVVCDKKINLDLTVVAVMGAAYRIRNLGQIRV